jgi:hypothetical protein
VQAEADEIAQRDPFPYRFTARLANPFFYRLLCKQNNAPCSARGVYKVSVATINESIIVQSTRQEKSLEERGIGIQ